MRAILCFFALTGILLACAGCDTTPAPTPTVPSPSATPLPPTPTSTSTVTPEPTPTATLTPTPEPVWYQPLDPSYTVLRYGYALVTDPDAGLYLSLQDAVDKSVNHGHLPFVPAYVAFSQAEVRDGRTFYALASGEWMAGEYLQEISPSLFTGILLARPVDFRFGWVLAETRSVNRAGVPVNTFTRYQVVHEFPAMEQNPGYIAIGADEWLPEESLALVKPQTPDPAGPCRFIYVSLPEQTMSVYDGCKLVFASLVSTGQETWWTPAGNFKILYKPADKYHTLSQPNEALSDYYLQAVPYFMSYIGNLAFHGAYWHDDFGYPVSHGCINLAPADARWLYEWAREGDWVIVSAAP